MSMSRMFRRAVLGGLLVAVPIGNAWATHRDEAEQAIEEAKAAHAAAQAAGVASEETAKLIKDAESILPDRQFTKARELAIKAMKQDTFAVEQAKGAATVDSGAAKQAQDAIAAAEAARKKASSVGGEWSEVGSLIKKSKELASAGDFKAAIATAAKAQRQGEMGYEQAMREKGAGFPSYVTKQQ